MPISAENLSRYPDDWPQISAWVRFERAGSRCECEGECGHDHGGRCPERHGEENTITGSAVVLTTAHLDHNPANCDPANLKAMDQRCHLSYDADHHRANAARTRLARRTAGMTPLFDLAEVVAQPKPPDDPSAARTAVESWCVEVKDILILSSRQGADWWLTFRHRFEPLGRIQPLEGTATPQGDHCLVACDSREDAERLAEHMVTFGGVPRTAVKARRAPREVTA